MINSISGSAPGKVYLCEAQAWLCHRRARPTQQRDGTPGQGDAQPYVPPCWHECPSGTTHGCTEIPKQLWTRGLHPGRGLAVRVSCRPWLIHTLLRSRDLSAGNGSSRCSLHPGNLPTAGSAPLQGDALILAGPHQGQQSSLLWPDPVGSNHPACRARVRAETSPGGQRPCLQMQGQRLCPWDWQEPGRDVEIHTRACTGERDVTWSIRCWGLERAADASRLPLQHSSRVLSVRTDPWLCPFMLCCCRKRSC